MLHFGLIPGFVHRTQHSGFVDRVQYCIYSVHNTCKRQVQCVVVFLPCKMHHYRFERGRETQAVKEEIGTYIPLTILPVCSKVREQSQGYLGTKKRISLYCFLFIVCVCVFFLPLNKSTHKPKRKWSESPHQRCVIVFVRSQNCEQWSGTHVIIQLLFTIKP